MSPKDEHVEDNKTSDMKIINQTDLENKTKNPKEGVAVTVNCGEETMDFDDAIDQIGAGRYTYTVLFICCYTLLVVTTEGFGIGLVVMSAQCELELDTYRKGIIGAVPMLGSIASSHMWGYMADTRGRRLTILTALAGCWIMGLASSFATHWIALAVFKFLSVTFGAGVTAVVYAILVEMTPKSLRNRYAMIVSIAFMPSQCLISSLAYITLRYDFSITLIGSLVYSPWRLMCQVFAFVNFVSMVLFLTLVHESPKFYLSQGREKDCLEVLSKIYAVNTGNKPESYAVKSVTMQEDTNKCKEGNLLVSMWNQTSPLFHKKYIKNTLTIMYVSLVVYSVTPPMAIWLPHVVNAFLRVSPDQVVADTFCGRVVTEFKRTNNASLMLGECDNSVEDFMLLILMTFGIYITVVAIISTILVRVLGKKIIVIILNFISACACFALNHLSGSFVSIAAFLAIVSNSIAIGIVSAFAVEVYPTYLRSMAVCLVIMVGRAFSFVVINLMGPQIENNCDNFFYVYGAFIFTAVIVGGFLPGELKKELPKHKRIEENIHRK